MDPARRTLHLLSLSFWTGTGVLCGVQIWLSMLSHGHQLWRVVLYQVLVWNGWSLLAPLVFAVAARFRPVPPTGRAVAVHLLVALAIAPVHALWWTVVLVALRPYDAMQVKGFAQAYPETALSGLPLELMLYCGVLVAFQAREYYARFRERERAAARLEVSLAEARLRALELQLQPHFLFNSLNSVSALVRAQQPSAAVAMIAGLSDLLRYTLDHAGAQRVTLGEEVDITARYLEIERVRFGDRMAFDLQVAPEARRAAVPTLLLQPLVENAVRHGIARHLAPGRVRISARREGTRLALEVFNTGVLAEPRQDGIGLRNTADRLGTLYGPAHGFGLRAVEGGVLASVWLPWSEGP